MKNKFLKLTLIVFILIFFKFNDLQAKKNKILFKIENHIITTIDLNQEINYLINVNKNLYDADKEIIYEIAKKTLIRNKIKEIEISKRLDNYSLDNKIIINLLIKQFQKNTETQLDEFFIQKNINKKFVINKIRNEILWNELIVSKFLNKVKVDLDKIKKNIKNNNNEKEYQLSEILFNLEKEENLEDKFDAIKEKIKNKNFAEAALTFSISSSSEKGGKIGWIKSSSLSKKLQNQLDLIKKNDYTKPIVIPGGFLILKINDIRLSKININLEEEIKKISQKQTQDQLEQYSIIYFNKIKKNLSVDEF